MNPYFTKYQKEEIEGLIDIREDTVEEDPESASGLELIPGGLVELRRKIKSDEMNFTPEEKKWLLEEFECRTDMALACEGTEGVKILGLLNSMNNAITKI